MYERKQRRSWGCRMPRWDLWPIWCANHGFVWERGITMGKDVEWEISHGFTSNLTSNLGHHKLLVKTNRQTLDMLQQKKILMKLDETHPNWYFNHYDGYVKHGTRWKPCFNIFGSLRKHHFFRMAHVEIIFPWASDGWPIWESSQQKS